MDLAKIELKSVELKEYEGAWQWERAPRMEFGNRRQGGAGRVDLAKIELKS